MKGIGVLVLINRIDDYFARACYAIMAGHYFTLCVLMFFDARAPSFLTVLLCCQAILCVVMLINNIRGRFYQGYKLVAVAAFFGLLILAWRIVMALCVYHLEAHSVVTGASLDGLMVVIMLYRFVMVRAMLRHSAALRGSRHDSQ